MGRAFDRAALKSQFLSGGIVVDRGVRIVDLRMKHLLRAAPRPDEHIAALQYFRPECRFCHLQNFPGSPLAASVSKKTGLGKGATAFRITTEICPAAMDSGWARIAKSVHSGRNETGPK